MRYIKNIKGARQMDRNHGDSFALEYAETTKRGGNGTSEIGRRRPRWGDGMRNCHTLYKTNFLNAAPST